MSYAKNVVVCLVHAVPMAAGFLWAAVRAGFAAGCGTYHDLMEKL